MSGRFRIQPCDCCGIDHEQRIRIDGQLDTGSGSARRFSRCHKCRRSCNPNIIRETGLLVCSRRAAMEVT